MGNPHRGEVEFDLASPDGDKITFTARPTFALIAAMEKAADTSILMLTAKLQSVTLTFTEVVEIAALAAKHADTRPDGWDKPDFKERLFATGPLKLIKPVSALIGAATSTGETPKKDDGATKKK